MGSTRHESAGLKLFAVVFTAVGAVNVAHSLEDTPIDLGPLLAPVRERFHAPGVAAAVTREGKLLAIGASGTRALDSAEPASITDRTLIGSCGKSLTRLLIARLVDRGLLKWDSTLADLLPDVPMRDEYKSVTIADIVAHSGGIQPYTQISPQRTPILFEGQGSPRQQRAAFVAHVLSEPPAAPPRTRMVYSNAGYGVLGHIAERLADKSFEQLMRDEVFRPLGMTTAVVGTPQTAASGWSGHFKTPEGFQKANARPGLPAIAPAGHMSCSIEDFAKAAAALVQIEAGKPTTFLHESTASDQSRDRKGAVPEKPAPFLSEATASRLPALRPGDSGEGEIFFGGEGTYTAAFALWPSHGVAIVVASNAGSSDNLCRAMMDAVREKVVPQIAAREPSGAGPESPSVGPAQRGKYGFQINAEDDDWSVDDVLPDSPAAAAGLKPGDRILTINDKDLKDISPDDRLTALKQSPVKLRIEREGKTIELTLRAP